MDSNNPSRHFGLRRHCMYKQRHGLSSPRYSSKHNGSMVSRYEVMTSLSPRVLVLHGSGWLNRWNVCPLVALLHSAIAFGIRKMEIAAVSDSYTVVTPVLSLGIVPYWRTGWTFVRCCQFEYLNDIAWGRLELTSNIPHYQKVSCSGKSVLCRW